MKNLNQIKQILKSQKPYLKKHYHVSEIGVFGSYIRGEQTEKSDVDILVDFTEVHGLFWFIEIEYYLSNLLGIKVDLVDREGLKPNIGKHILREVVYL